MLTKSIEEKTLKYPDPEQPLLKPPQKSNHEVKIINEKKRRKSKSIDHRVSGYGEKLNRRALLEQDNPLKSCGIYIILLITVFSLTGTILMCFTDFYDSTIQKLITISNGTYVYKIWRDTPVEGRAAFYFFNYTNVDEILSGKEKPTLYELGPYTFRHEITKTKLKFHDTKYISYMENITNSFIKEDSVGSLDDLVTIPNAFVLSSLEHVKKMNMFSQLSYSMTLKTLKVSPFIQVTVKELIFGFDQNITFFIHLMAFTNLDREYSTALFNSRNGLTQELLTINTGVHDLSKIGLIHHINDEERINKWNDEGECNNVTAFDGLLFPAKKYRQNDTLYLYRRVVCRRLPLVYEKDVYTQQGYPAKRYVASKNTFSYGEENPQNQCFCLNNECMTSGAMDISPCAHGLPIFISFPHFLYGDTSINENFIGLKPDPAKHRTYTDIHDNGIGLAGKISLQAGIILHKAPYVQMFKHLKDGLPMPLLWIQLYSMNLTGTANTLIYHLSFTSPILKLSLQWSFPIIFLLTFSKLVLYFIRLPILSESFSYYFNKNK